MIIKKLIITKDKEFSINWVKEDTLNRIRYSEEEAIQMLVTNSGFCDNIRYNFMRFAMQKELNIIIHTNNIDYLIEQISDDVKNRNSYNKRIKKDIRYELEFL